MPRLRQSWQSIGQGKKLLAAVRMHDSGPLVEERRGLLESHLGISNLLMEWGT